MKRPWPIAAVNVAAGLFRPPENRQDHAALPPKLARIGHRFAWLPKESPWLPICLAASHRGFPPAMSRSTRPPKQAQTWAKLRQPALTTAAPAGLGSSH
jgi:hypothetical protein